MKHRPSLNFVYRLLWNERLGIFVPVAECIPSRGRRGLVAAQILLACWAVPYALAAPPPNALPTGGQVTAGSGSIASSGKAMTVNQNTNRMVANWNTFDIGANASVTFNQPGVSSVALNRISDQNPSQIFGQLSANGQVYLTNPSGIVFGPSAQVNVGGLVASSLNMSEKDFMAGQNRFTGGGSGEIINQGNLNTHGGGVVALVGPAVKNEGTINTPDGRTLLAAGQDVKLDFDGDGLINYRVDGGAVNAASINSGTVAAGNGMVVMTARAADGLIRSVVNNEGIIEANSLVNTGGRIILDAGEDGGQVLQSGNVAANGLSGGGKIEITAGQAVVNTGGLEASGNQGGQITVNTKNLIEAGGYAASGKDRGGAISIQASGHIEQTAASTIIADATKGQGGEVRIKADGNAWLSGKVSATGKQGGEIAITAPDVVLAGAGMNADGQNKGGRIRVGGGWQGGDADLANAGHTRLVKASLSANALTEGDGGTVVVWSEENTLFGGSIEAKGGETSGNGGRVEVSSHGVLGFGGEVAVQAPHGTNGQLLLDPKDINIVDTVSGISVIPLIDPAPGANDRHGNGGAVELINNGVGTDRVVLASPNDSDVANNAGAVRLYKISDGILLATLTGSTANDSVGYGITALTNGNYVIQSSGWDNGAATDAGAVTWGNGTTGITGTVSAANSLVGSTAGDMIGDGGVTALSNGNYVVSSSYWDNGASYKNAGAVTWGNGTTGVTGTVSTANSLVGSTAGDMIGYLGVTALSNGNYVVSSPDWDNGAAYNAGAVTWGNGTIGITGVVSAANSLVGSTASDYIGTGYGGITALTNGNYVVRSHYWDNGAATDTGAVTWGNGTTGITGAVSAANSLVGSTAGDMIGYDGVTALSNGNYVVDSPYWDNGAATDAGAVTWGNGTTGVTGVVSTANSLVGSTAGDLGGYDGGVTALSNGNYVVSSPYWDNGAAYNNAGAVTWGNGTTGVTGVVSTANSLVGSTAGDMIGYDGVTALSNGNYVVSSPYWHNGAAYNAGAVTWGNGTTGITGVVSAANSLVGSTAVDYNTLIDFTTGDQIGSGGVTALTNGNYVVSSPYWDNGAADNNVGAVTWGNGTTGVTGIVSTANSLVGSTAIDLIGYGGITALSNGNYVVSSPDWDNGAAYNAGAVTWGNGTTGITGVVSTANSLVGSTASDQIGGKVVLFYSYIGDSGSVTALSNGNYVVSSPDWDKGAVIDAGAVTWGNGTTGITGVVSTANSLVGSTAGDLIGSGAVTSLTNGNYVVSSPHWSNRAATGGAWAVIHHAGAATLGNGTTGITGVVSTNNSLVGSTNDDMIGGYSYYGAIQNREVTALTNGDVIVYSLYWDNGDLVDAGRVDVISAATTRTNLNLANPHTFVTNSTGTSTILASDITALLDAGTSLTLQANNDITLSTALTANNASGSGGALTMQAGRSVLLNANITSDNGDVTITANESVANGVIDAQRDAGSAAITMANGTTIDAGTGTVRLTLANSTDKTNNTAGDIILAGITAGALNLNNAGGGNITGTQGVLAVSGATDISTNANVNLTNTSNNFSGTISVASAHNLFLINSDAMSLGAVNTTGTVDIATLINNLTLTGPISTTDTSASAVTLNAGRSMAADTSTGGNLMVSGGSISVGEGGRATLFSGSVSGSTGLTGLVGTGSSNFRYGSDEIGTNYTNALGAGKYAVYREQPTVTITAKNDSKPYIGLAYSGGNGVTYRGFTNGDTSGVLDGTLAYGGTSQGATDVGSYTIVPSGYTNDLGYALAYANGTLKISPTPIPELIRQLSANNLPVTGCLQFGLSWCPGLPGLDNLSGTTSSDSGANHDESGDGILPIFL